MAHQEKSSTHPTQSGAFCTQNNNSGTQNNNSGTQNKDSGTQNKDSGIENKASGSGLRDSGSATSATTSATIATTRATSATTSATSATTSATIASLEAQMASLEEQIALLKEESRLQEEASNANPEVHRVVGRTGTPVGKPGGPKSEASPPTPPPTGEETIQYLHTMFEELQILFGNFSELLPQLENTTMNAADRMRLLGSGVRRYGFIEKVFEVSGDFPQFWPHFGEGRKEMDQFVKEIDVLRNLLIWFRQVARTVQDLLLLSGNDAFRVARAYYAFARESARQKNPEAVQVYDMLRLFWNKRRRTNGEPTIPEVERDASDLLHGRKDGEIFIKHESPTLTGGVHEVVDEVRRS